MEGCKEARVAVEDDRMLTFELEAAEALAGMARYSSVRSELEQLSSRPFVTETGVVSSHPSQDQEIGGNASNMDAGPVKPVNTVDTAPSQTCRTSYRSKVASTLRQKLTEAEKDARKLHRILANRESARQTIRRRRIMFLELADKADDLLAENTNLKKEKDLALKKYNSLKEKNQFLKAEMAKRKEAVPAGEIQEPRLSRAEIACGATAPTPIYLCDQPSLVPFFWPSIVPSDIFNPQCASHSDVTSASQFLVPSWDKHCPNLGQKWPSGINKLGTPLYVLRVPWLLPFLPPSSTLEPCSGNSDRQNTTLPVHHCHMCSSSGTLVHEDNHKLLSNQNTRVEAFNSARVASASHVLPAGGGSEYTGLLSNQNTRVEAFNSARVASASHVLPAGGGSEYTGPHLKAAVPDVNAVSSVPKDKSHGYLKKYQRPFISPSKKSGDVIAATEARRKRKELMKLKNIHFHNAHA